LEAHGGGGRGGLFSVADEPRSVLWRFGTLPEVLGEEEHLLFVLASWCGAPTAGTNPCSLAQNVDFVKDPNRLFLRDVSGFFVPGASSVATASIKELMVVICHSPHPVSEIL